MKKTSLSLVILLMNCCAHAQNISGKFFYQPFPLNSVGGKVILAGNVSTFLYSEYYGKNVMSEKYSDVHANPEYLVYELFRDMKAKNTAAIASLYDSSYDKSYFDGDMMSTIMSRYEDIRFQSKFRCGDRMVIRYDFVSPGNVYPFFATVRMIKNRYYLTLNLELADPLNLLGTFSPYNISNEKIENVDSTKMTAFYFVRKDGRSFYTTQAPPEEYTALYIAFSFYTPNKTSPESEFIKKLQKVASAKDSAGFKKMVFASDLPLLADPFYHEYFKTLLNLFADHPTIAPVALINTSEDKIFYLNYSDTVQSPKITSINLKESGGKMYLSFSITNKVVNQVLENIYVQDAINGYLAKRR